MFDEARVCVYVDTDICLYIRSRVCMYVCIYLSIRHQPVPLVDIYVCMYVCMYGARCINSVEGKSIRNVNSKQDPLQLHL